MTRCTHLTPTSLSLLFPFKLSRLELFFVRPRASTPPLWTVSPLLLQPSITDLNFQIDERFTPSDLTNLFLPSLIRLAPNLTTLRIDFSPTQLHALLPYFHRCTSLHHLTSTVMDALVGIFGRLGCLESWTDLSYPPDLVATLGLLRGIPTGQLKWVHYYAVTRHEMQRFLGYDDLMEEFRRKGTKLVFWGER